MDVAELKKQAQEALDAGDVAKAKELIAQLRALKEQEQEQEDLSQELADLTKNDAPEDVSKNVSEDKPEEDLKEESEELTDKPEKPEELEEKPEEKPEPEKDPEKEDEKEKKKKKGEKRNMGPEENVETRNFKPVEKNNTEERAIGVYIKSKGIEVRDGLTTEGAEAVIPIQRLTAPQEQPYTVPDLRQLANRVTVNTGSGSYPVLKATKAKMNTVEELQKNPELAKPEFLKIAWEIATYRGYIPISKEALDDSDQNLAGIVADHINKQSLNTSNGAIATVLQTAKPKTVNNIDGLKTIQNVELDPAYNVGYVVTQSFFNELDKMKDNDGRYLLQQDVTAASGYKLLGRQVTVIADDLLGKEKGDQVAFVGDVQAFVSFFDRAQATVRWTDNDVYGELLAGMIRFDVERTDEDSGFFVTLDLDGSDNPSESA